MNKYEISDENSLIEMYIHHLLDNGNQVERIGHILEFENLGIYFCFNEKTRKFCVITSEYDIFKDKRIKNPLTRYKKSVVFLYPMEKSWSKLTKKTYSETLKFIAMGERGSDIIFMETNNFNFIKDFLKNE